MAVQLQDSTALVTGATGGIGQAIVRALHARGATVFASGRNARGARAARARARAASSRWSPTCPIRPQVAALVFGRRIDVLVANAALPASGRLESFTAEEIDRALDVNLRAPMQLARALLPRDDASAAPATSCSSRRCRARWRARARSVYNATKFGLRGFGFALNEELRGTGVGATTVFPGFIRDAGMFADSGVKLPRGVGTRTPDEVAER